MMNDKDIEDYHNIGKAIKYNSKYNYHDGKQITDEETGKRVYEINSYRLPSVTTILGATKDQQFLKDWKAKVCLLYTSPSPRDRTRSRMPSSA